MKTELGWVWRSPETVPGFGGDNKDDCDMQLTQEPRENKALGPKRSQDWLGDGYGSDIPKHTFLFFLSFFVIVQWECGKKKKNSVDNRALERDMFSLGWACVNK